MLKSTQKIIVTLVTFLIVGFLSYTFFIKNTPTIDSVKDLSSEEIAGEDILALVEKLKLISIDQSIFSSPLFNNLKDFGITPTGESQGRVNPFAQIGVEFGFQGVTNSSTKKK